MEEIILTNENFEDEVLKCEGKILVDFWATWCGPCRMIAPTVEEIAEERSDIKVGKVNVDEQAELANAFGITSIPTLVVLKNGKVTNQLVGVRPKDDILRML